MSVCSVVTVWVIRSDKIRTVTVTVGVLTDPAGVVLAVFVTSHSRAVEIDIIRSVNMDRLA